MAKTSLHSGRRMSAKHNDRTFKMKEGEAYHIDPELTKENQHYTAENGKMSQEELLKKTTIQEDYFSTYSKLFAEALDAQNQRYIDARHPEKCKTMEDWFQSSQKKPRETIFQIGNHESEIEIAKKVDVCVEQLRKELEEKYPDNYHCLGWSFHVDEIEFGTPHIHLNDIFAFKNEAGVFEPSQDKALEQMGFELPNPAKKKSQFNNRVMTFTKWQRERFIDICREHGLEIEEPAPTINPQKYQETKRDFDKKIKEMEDKISSLEKKNEQLEKKASKLEELAKQPLENPKKLKRIEPDLNLFDRKKPVPYEAYEKACNVADKTLKDNSTLSNQNKLLEAQMSILQGEKQQLKSEIKEMKQKDYVRENEVLKEKVDLFAHSWKSTELSLNQKTKEAEELKEELSSTKETLSWYKEMYQQFLKGFRSLAEQSKEYVFKWFKPNITKNFADDIKEQVRTEQHSMLEHIKSFKYEPEEAFQDFMQDRDSGSRSNGDDFML